MTKMSVFTVEILLCNCEQGLKKEISISIMQYRCSSFGIGLNLKKSVCISKFLYRALEQIISLEGSK